MKAWGPNQFRLRKTRPLLKRTESSNTEPKKKAERERMWGP